MIWTPLFGREPFSQTMLQMENTVRGPVHMKGHRTAFCDHVRALCEGEPEFLATVEPLLGTRGML